MSKRAISAKISMEIYEQLALAAERSDRSMSWIVEQALENYLALDEATHGAVVTGLAELAAHNLVPHAEIRAWATGIPGDTP